MAVSPDSRLARRAGIGTPVRSCILPPMPTHAHSLTTLRGLLAGLLLLPR